MDDGRLDELARHIGRAVREARTARGLSVGALAREAGLSKTILSRIEAGDGNPSMGTLWRVSQALGLPMGALLEPDAGPGTRVVRARSGEEVREDSGLSSWLIAVDGRPHRGELHELELPAGLDQPREPHLPGTEELVLCTSGRVLVGPIGEEAELGPGDAVTFAGDVAHRYVGLEDASCLCWLRYRTAAT